MRPSLTISNTKEKEIHPIVIISTCYAININRISMEGPPNIIQMVSFYDGTNKRARVSRSNLSVPFVSFATNRSGEVMRPLAT